MNDCELTEEQIAEIHRLLQEMNEIAEIHRLLQETNETAKQMVEKLEAWNKRLEAENAERDRKLRKGKVTR